MDLFIGAKTIRLVSHGDKYLVAEEDRRTVSLGRDPSAENAIWAVELAGDRDCICLRSCYGTYLTASGKPFLPGVTAKSVVQARGQQSWEAYRDGMQVRLRSVWGNFLRPNGGLPPWRNAITHDLPHRGTTRNKMLWDVDVVERCPATRKQLSFCRSSSAHKQNELRSVLLLDDQVSHSFFGMACCYYPRAHLRLSS
ncbi:Protein of unknown function (DUF569 [Striga hermonthica]|uniref:DUF569 domain-containing protein n=1 Tax=Striga hermonthica TaxID=68872 RepID=A0A9N7RPP3_STRHE|nr:Protein of unknown function (DUF569 [Striga hermonthica]